MAPVIPSPVKRLIVEAYRDGMRVSAISRMYKIKENSVKSVIHRKKKFGVIKRIRKGKPKKLQQIHVDALRSWLEEDCQRTLSDLSGKLEEEYGVKVCPSTIWNYLEALHFSVKRISPIPLARNSQENIATRRAYGLKFLEMDQHRESIIFIDETGVAVHSRSNYGRAPRGQRANLEVRAIRGANFSVCAAMSYNGLIHYEARDTAYNSFCFTEFLKSLVEKLEEKSITKAYLVMDNVRFHHTEEVQSLIASTNHEIVFLPPYSPFINPIENLFNQLKFYVKRLKPSCPDEVYNSLSLASEVITENDCQNYYRHMMTYIPKCIDSVPIEN
ncbi:uncharacterized protein LOC141851541 [Brevipalpus obovatus]|uniref:uncharacterized protein LOC141851541 n=1 Tax=Brevipalpus obovatus TaxID=246614 RepID=UPI003D9E65DF